MSAIIRPFLSEDVKEIREIFFQTSTKKDFPSNEAREAFYYKYVGFYLKTFPEFAFVAKESRILGYVLGASHSNLPELEIIQPHLNIFQSEIKDYPAHLHINCLSGFQGKGLGSQLVMRMCDLFSSQKIKGIHIITSVDASNQFFYAKLGFCPIGHKIFNGADLLFMGKVL